MNPYRCKVAAAAALLGAIETAAWMRLAPTWRTRLGILRQAPRYIGATVRTFDQLARGRT
ncbi:MAG: hypothetical protein ACOCUS_00055 [Polyangiales bacterium]